MCSISCDLLSILSIFVIVKMAVILKGICQLKLLTTII